MPPTIIQKLAEALRKMPVAGSIAGWKPNTVHLAGYRQLIDVFVERRLGQRMPWGRGLPAGSRGGFGR